MGTPLLQIYREGKLHDLWQERSQKLIEANQHVSPNRCKAIMAAILAYGLMSEACQLERKVKPFTMTPEEADLYDWLYVEDNARYCGELQAWSGTRTMLADMPSGDYKPEWMEYIEMPEEEGLC
jgi:hypothetical protein